MTDLLSKELIADMTFRVKYINKDWKEETIDYEEFISKHSFIVQMLS